MNFSYNWLREYLPGLKLGPAELAQQITMHTAECEGVTPTAPSASDAQDFIIEINNKSLTNRPDLWGHFGMAREIAAFCHLSLVDPVASLPSMIASEQITLEPGTGENCHRFSAALLEDIKICPSPAWLRSRLQDLGHTSRNNVVDVTNYVMLELGQPTHAYDADRLGTSLAVRRARPNEAFAALNGESYQLAEEDIVIASPDSAVGLAGIIGGAETAISNTTTRVLLEAAAFPAEPIRKTSSRIKLRTDASMRYEKGQDPENTMRALARIVTLLENMASARIVAITDQYVHRIPCPRIVFNLDWAERRLGRTLATEETLRLLKSLFFGVKSLEARTLEVHVPSWRATRDVSIAEDLLEEVGRILGYDSIAAQPPTALVTQPRIDPRQLQLRDLRNLFVNQGFTEVSNYSFIPDAALATFAYDPATLLQIANPIISDQNFLRPGLTPGIVRNIVENSRYFNDFRLFEIGRTYQQGADGKAIEDLHAAAAVYGPAEDGAQLYELKRIVRFLNPEITAIPASESSTLEHPQRTAVLKVREIVVGRLFELNPTLLPRGRAAILSLSLDLLHDLRSTNKSFKPSRRFPTSSFDLSILAQQREPVGTVEALLRRLGQQELVALEFLDTFAMPSGQKSATFRFTFGADDRTLTSDDLAGIRARILAGIEAAGYDFRH